MKTFTFLSLTALLVVSTGSEAMVVCAGKQKNEMEEFFFTKPSFDHSRQMVYK